MTLGLLYMLEYVPGEDKKHHHQNKFYRIQINESPTYLIIKLNYRN